MASKLNFRNFLALLIVVLGSSLAATVVYNFKGGFPEKIVESLPRNVDLSLKKIKYTETRGGKRSWTLTADSVAHSASEKTTRVENIRMTFYDEQMGDVTITAEQGELKIQEREVTASGNVVVDSPEGYTVFADRLYYSEADRSIRTTGPVRVVGERIEIAGDGMRLDVERRRLELLSAVGARLALDTGKKGD